MHILSALYLSFLLLSLAAGAPPYAPTDYILLDCGSPVNSSSEDGRNWEADIGSKFSSTDLQSTSPLSTASEQNPSVTQVPYMTARIFHSQFTYSFPVSDGPKFVRLYFYPASYSGLEMSKSFFTITANTYTLVSNFSAYLAVSTENPPVPSLVKEFCINTWDNQRLNITFSPSPSSYGFINGIEIVSMPYSLYYLGDSTDNPIKFVDRGTYFDLENSTAFETIYRINVGGQDVSGNGDTGMFRAWQQDLPFVFGNASGTTPFLYTKIHYTPQTPAYTAPEIVYTTYRTMGRNPQVNLNYNLTWLFPVDTGFYYFVRLHFCETLHDVTLPNQRVFTIFVNNQTAEEQMDVIEWSGGSGIPIYRDYVVWVQNPYGHRSKQDLWLALHPFMGNSPPPEYDDAILNGAEIFKLNQSDGSLAGPNPSPLVGPTPPQPSPEKTKSKGSSPGIVIAGAVGGGGVLIVGLCLLCFLICRRHRRVKDSGSKAKSVKSSASSLPSDLCRRFSIDAIRAATRNFHGDFLIGSGGFGNVYKGYISDGTTPVAIKRLKPSSKQGAHEFVTEIKMLSKLRHVHLVSLIGYCDDGSEMILVYEFMANGNLRDHLYKTKNPPLPWKDRLQICIGAARGLHYLHMGAKQTIIHRDVNSTNILLDEKWVAKVSDFGLSKPGPTDVSRTHVSTVVKGSFGYVDPEYFRRQQLTEKSDVYSFGVVLFEVLCARPAVVLGPPKEQVSLAEWAKTCYQSGTLDQIIDPTLRDQIAPESLRKFGEIADSCVRDHGIERPAMGDVVWALEFALQLQENFEKINGGYGVDVKIPGGNRASPVSSRGEVITADDDDMENASDSKSSKSSV